MAKESSNSNGIGFTGVLTILFIALKLTGYITWSWWWVLSPIWITLLVIIVVFLGMAMFMNKIGRK